MKGFGIEIKNDLLDPKHLDNMGVSVWLYMWLIDKMTSITEEGVGLILGGKPIVYDEIATELGIPERTYYRWIRTLKMKNYILVTRTAKGLVLQVTKAYKQFGNRYAKSGNSDMPKMATQSATNGNSLSIQIQRQHSKTTPVDLKKEFFEHPLMLNLQKAFPNRNYDLEFDLMADWWIRNKKKLPKNISAFKNWLSNTKPQTETTSRTSTANETKQMLERLAK